MVGVLEKPRVVSELISSGNQENVVHCPCFLRREPNSQVACDAMAMRSGVGELDRHELRFVRANSRGKPSTTEKNCGAAAGEVQLRRLCFVHWRLAFGL